jgi:hypothetical protein
MPARIVETEYIVFWRRQQDAVSYVRASSREEAIEKAEKKQHYNFNVISSADYWELCEVQELRPG